MSGCLAGDEAWSLALTPAVFPSASAPILWNPLEFLQERLQLKNKLWKLNKRFFKYCSNSIHVNECKSARSDVMQYAGHGWQRRTLDLLGLGEMWTEEQRARPLLQRGPFTSAPAYSRVLALELLCSPSDCFHMPLLPLHVTGWGHLCV